MVNNNFSSFAMYYLGALERKKFTFVCHDFSIYIISRFFKILVVSEFYLP